MQATTAPGSSSGQFVDKTDLAPGTKWTATDANAWQAELLEVITESGLVPSGGDLTQLRQAIQLLAKLVKVDLATAADTAKTAETGEDAALPFALVQSGGGGYKALKVSDAGGTYNPETNTAAVNVSGNAATATKLATARTIGGVSFDGSANINLPGVNAAGNQNTSGNASTATNSDTVDNYHVTTVGNGLRAIHGNIHEVAGASTISQLFAILAPAVPSTNNICAISGAIGALRVSHFKRINSGTIYIYGLNGSNATETAVYQESNSDPSSSAISVSW